jgi:lysophospholipase L1-like esterase
MTHPRSLLLATAIVLAAGAILGVAALVTPMGATRERSAEERWPRSMAALGDSITQAVDVTGDLSTPWAVHSWTTGDDESDRVTSHYERILSVKHAISGAAFNLAVPGARMSDAPRQAHRAVARHVEYVTLLMGANDVCTASPATMTPVASFRRSFEETMQILAEGLPHAVVYVVSVPNVYRLWRLLRADFVARATWRAFHICPALLSEDRSEAARRLVYGRLTAFNKVLADVCSEDADCYFDGGAVFSFRFGPGDVSKIDYFHPSLAGQEKIAELTWRHAPFVRR